MKNVYFVIVIMCLFALSCKKEKVDDPIIVNNFNGKVKTILENNYFVEVINGNEHISIYNIIEYLYDENGNETEKCQYKADGSLQFKYESKYDQNGKLTYNNVCNSDGSLEQYYTYSYDNKKRMTESKLYLSDNKLAEYWIYTYDEKDNMTENIHYKSDGNIMGIDKFKYDDKGQAIKVIHYRSDGSLYSIFTYEYDIRYLDKVVLWRYQRFQMGNLDIYLIYKYDDKGNITEFNETDADGYLYPTKTYEYDEYDKLGNWIKRKEFWANKLIIITERKIEYY